MPKLVVPCQSNFYLGCAVRYWTGATKDKHDYHEKEKGIIRELAIFGWVTALFWGLCPRRQPSCEKQLVSKMPQLLMEVGSFLVGSFLAVGNCYVCTWSFWNCRFQVL
ncbi:hypothetical protein KP509_30G057900 [Ceratopteris richardii]|uniref:Uncharacterized protein n=1 Tax=Ceratopteris richardii TaxID=49495 RepID=A0A8T2R4X7_CERRI|nr:hypothetical protein KP509_30G057900 [Ceratopteris richardii]